MLTTAWQGPSSHWFPVLAHVLTSTPKGVTRLEQVSAHLAFKGVFTQPWHSLLVFKRALQSPLSRSPSTSLRCPAQPHTGLHSKPHLENNPDLTPHPPGGWLKTRCFPTLVWRAACRGE